MSEQPRAALVVIDLVEDYFDDSLWPGSRIPGARGRLVRKTNALVSICRTAGIPVIWVRQEFLSDLSDAFLHMRRSGKRYAVRGTPGCALLPELLVSDADTVLPKKRFSAFFETDLDAELAKSGAHTLIIAGITTAWCVRSTAVDAYQRDYEVVLARECMDGFTAEDHEASLVAMDGYIGTACTNLEIGETLAGPLDRPAELGRRP